MKKSNIFNKRNVTKSSQPLTSSMLCDLCDCVLFESIRCLSCSKNAPSKPDSGNYCGECFNKFQQEVGSCPQMCQSPRTKPLCPKILKELDKLEFMCSNKANGCSHISSYSDVISHHKECGFAQICCKAYPLCEDKFLRKDITLHEKHCKYVKISCQFCGQKELLRGQLETHFEQKCVNAKKCEKCYQHHAKLSSRETQHSCVEALSQKISAMEDLHLAKDTEHQEQLRKRDVKISSLMRKQREIWKYLTKIEASLNKQVAPSMPISALHPNSVNEDISDKCDDLEDFFSYSGQDVSEVIHPLSDTNAENETAMSTFRSEEAPKVFGHRKRAESTFIKRTNNQRMIDEESKSCESDSSIELKKRCGGTSCCQSPCYLKNSIVTEELIQQKLQFFQDCARNEEKWKKHSTKNGVELKLYSGEGNHTGVYGKTIMPYNTQFILDVLGDHKKTFNTNQYAEEIEILEKFGENCIVAYMRFKGLLMVSGRDFVVAQVQTTMTDPDNKAEKMPIVVSFTVDHPDAPTNPKGTVRGDMIIAGWTLKKISDTETEVVSFAVNDLKGSIPKFVINVGASSHSTIMVNFMKELEKTDKENSGEKDASGSE
ncbi:unnamed protein product [Moneuplotes crassus]|uniref:Uncharacterized protein n=1 Tax=Euplotes crassus TaxID=5936 RepID=A0AAD2DCE9_EUPCR|nr:unnamed protein product [Moneuplotes crassus]